MISIHAPTKGATPRQDIAVAQSQDFNPRSHEGSDSSCGQLLLLRRYFNPRSHEGSDEDKDALRPLGVEFQSTLPRRERRFGRPHKMIRRVISIHAPTKGATKADTWYTMENGISIHAPTKGATVTKACFEPCLKISIHAPTKGATKGWENARGCRIISIHAPTKGATMRSCSLPGL